jgi:hypothetical protein
VEKVGLFPLPSEIDSACQDSSQLTRPRPSSSDVRACGREPHQPTPSD